MPPFGSSRGGNSDAFIDSMIDCLHQYHSLGSVVICGDLNARCGYEVDLHEDYVGIIHSRKSIYEVKNQSGDMLLQFLRDCKLCMVNGRSGKDNFTCVLSPKGRSVVDYCIVECDYFYNVTNFSVTTLSEFLEENNIVETEQLPDHSIISWELDGAVPTYRNKKEQGTKGVHLSINEEYLADKELELEAILDDIKSLTNCD